MVNILIRIPFVTLHYLHKQFIFFQYSLKSCQDLPSSAFSSPTLLGGQPSNMPCPQSSKIAFSESSSFCKATSQCMWFLLNLEFPHLVPFIFPACFLITSIYDSCFSSILALWQSLSGCPPSPPPLALCSTPRHWFPSFLYNPLHHLLLIVMGTSISPLHLSVSSWVSSWIISVSKGLALLQHLESPHRSLCNNSKWVQQTLGETGF